MRTIYKNAVDEVIDEVVDIDTEHTPPIWVALCEQGDGYARTVKVATFEGEQVTDLEPLEPLDGAPPAEEGGSKDHVLDAIKKVLADEGIEPEKQIVTPELFCNSTCK